MEHIGLYQQITEFSMENAGTSEWCMAQRDGRQYFVKKFHSPVYPTKESGLPEKMLEAGIAEFKNALNAKRELYQRLRECDQSDLLVVPSEVISFQFHICTIAEYVKGNVPPERVCALSEWQRLILLRTLTLALMNVHRAGVVHSDMKPENVLISQDEEGRCRLRLIDFDGSFFESEPPADAEALVGDPTYAAPEAYLMSMDEHVQLGHQIDVFALGMLFHYYWCGKIPGTPEDKTVAECVLCDEEVQLDESIPPVLAQLIRKMLQAKPENRLSLQSVYDVLGIQAEQYPPTLIRPQGEDAAPPRKEARIRINLCGENGEILKSSTLKIPYGTKTDIEAEEIEGYQLVGAKTKKIEVDSMGRSASPYVFTYKKGEVKSHAGKGRKIVFALLSAAVVCGLCLCAIYMDAYKNGRYADTDRFNQRQLFMERAEETPQESVQSAEATATEPPQWLTEETEVLPEETEAPPEVTRHFELGSTLEESLGRFTVRWTDSAEKGPYTVAYKCISEDGTMQSSFWAGGNQEKSTTDSHSFTIDSLAPGGTYRIMVEDCDGAVANRDYTLLELPFYGDANLTADDISVTISPRQRDWDADKSEATSVPTLNGWAIIENMGKIAYGFRYDIDYPTLQHDRNAFLQIFVTASNGYRRCLVRKDIALSEGTNGVYWEMLGSEAFKSLYENCEYFPVGQWTVDLYLDGFHANQSYFNVD